MIEIATDYKEKEKNLTLALTPPKQRRRYVVSQRLFPTH